MKKLFVASLLAMGLSLPVMASRGASDAPVNPKGASLDPRFAGVSTCMITNSTGTAALLCDTGAGIVLEVIGSSVATTDYLTFRDSATANTTSTELARINQGSLAGIKTLPRYKNGLSVNASAAPGAGPCAWTIIYVPLD